MIEEKKFIIDVIPLTRLPLTRQQSFSYLHSEKIPFGTLVSVPLFRREVRGIAINNRDDFFRFGNIKLKKINKILDEKFLTEKQLELAKFISDYYLCPLGIVLKFFVIKRAKARDLQLTTYNLQQKNINLDKEQKKIAIEINKKAVSGKLLVNSYLLIAGGEKIEIYLELISKITKTKKQVLLLVPEISLAYQSLDIIKEYFDEKIIALFHSKLTGSELYENYQKIKSGEAKIIIGTRQAVFAPFKNLAMIIVDEEQDISYKQWDMNPRYNAKDAAYKLAELFNSKLLFCSVAPSVETYYKIPNSKIQNPSKSQIPNLKSQNIDIIDMRKEGWSNNSRKRNNNIIFSKKLEAEIGWTLKRKKQAFLFINRRGMSSFSICESCKEVLRCPRCERALIYDQEGYYRCFHCNHKTSIFPHCPKCQGTTFKNIGIGNQTIEREIKKIFPGAKTKLVDFESLKNKTGQKTIFREINDKKYDIIIGTQAILKSWLLPHLGLVGIINADELLNFPGLNSDERAFQILTKAKNKAQNSRLIIQTYSPENNVINCVANDGLENFYKKILEERNSLKYPPFYKIIKLTLRAKNKNSLEREIQIIFNAVKKISEKENDMMVFDPLVPLLSKIRDSYQKNIVIKIKGDMVPQDLLQYLKRIGSEWIVDIDPINLN